MANHSRPVVTSGRPLRLWPGVTAAMLLVTAVIGTPLVVPGGAGLAVMAGVAGGMLIALWWLLFSRAPWLERLGAIVLAVLAIYVGRFFVDRSIDNGMMGYMLPVYSIPVLGLALVVWAAATRQASGALRRVSLVAAMFGAVGLFALVRTGGVSGEGAPELHWRWTATPEERLLAQALPALDTPPAVAPAPAPATPPPARADAPASTEKSVPPGADAKTAVAAAEPAPAVVAEWPGFRGPGRDSHASGARIDTDWISHPPVELWRRPIGPGWSSFAVQGDLVFTQEQRGDDELVSCYRLTTGEVVWTHRDPVRFWESNGGAGPRATPTWHAGRVYTFGATGLLNALDAGTGTVIWSRNAAADTKTVTPTWGFASSPLVWGDLVIVATAGQLAAYDRAAGQPRWMGPSRGGGYSSPHLVTIGGVPQILLQSDAGTTAVAAADGTVLWEQTWAGGTGIIQPALVSNGDVLVASADAMGGLGIRRVTVSHSGADATRGTGGWTVEERWASRGLKPYFNDFVVHKGHAYGFDGSILAAIDLADGARSWKGGRYGHGQLLLLPDQDVLLVLSEDGELALVSAKPDQFTELGRVPALQGKTWNHPVLVGDVVLVRNGEEMAAFRLARADR